MSSAARSSATTLRGTMAAQVPSRAERCGALRIAVFLLLLGLCAASLHALIQQRLRSVQTGELGVWNRIVDGHINADVLITGSSRAQSHYDAPLLAQLTGLSVYNIGLNGSQTDMQLARLKTYLRHNRPPRWLIHNLDAFAFQVSHDHVYDPGQYVPYLDEPDLFAALSRVDPGVWMSRHVPLYGYANDLRLGWAVGLGRTLLAGEIDPLADGFRAHHAAWTGEFERFRAANPKGVHIPIEPAGLQQFEELLELCREHGVGIILSYSPEYRPVQQMTRNRADILARFHRMAGRYGALVLDFSDSPISEKQAYFYNSQHLNAEGARAFTKELAARLAAGPLSAPKADARP